MKSRWMMASAVLGLLWSTLPAAAEEKPVVIGLIGDSTVCDYPADAEKRGWGQLLKEYLQPGTVVVNRARGGASTRSLPAANWKEVREAKPDYVFIQFGHNDMKKDDPSRYADPQTLYRDELRRYVSEAREVGAVPVLVTPVSRRTYRNGVVTTELIPYADATKVVGREMGVAVIDLNAFSRERFQRLGENGTEGDTMNRRLNPEAARGDRTHFTESGAREMAKLVVEGFPLVDSRLNALRKK